MTTMKKTRIHGKSSGRNYFDALSDELIISILIKTSASAKSPSDILGVMSSCKRMKQLGKDTIILRNLSAEAISIRAKSWCEPAHQFLSRCSDAGNMEATYMLGMIEFYCLAQYAHGSELLARAAKASHPEALFSLGIIQLRGSGNNSGPHCRYDPRNGIALCYKAATIGQRDANAELKNRIKSICMQSGGQTHPANLFLAEWWLLSDVKPERESNSLRLCSCLCGRRETRTNEFLNCFCESVFYCSYSCWNMHWKLEHHSMCDENHVTLNFFKQIGY